MILRLGERAVDVTHRALVMGILNRTPDSFYDQGEFWDFDAFLRRAEEHVNNGADILDVGGVKAGPGPEVTEAEELERVLPAIAALVMRFDVPVSVDTWRASVARGAYEIGAVVGNDISGFGDPDYLPFAAQAGATVIATHIRLQPRIADPEPVYDDVVRDVNAFLATRAQWALEAGVAADRIVLDAGLDLGKTWQQSLTLLRNSATTVALGYPVLLSSSNKTFLGKLLDLEVGERREASHAATALGVIGGCRIVRVHDVAGSRRVCDFLAALSEETSAA
ncbi:MAG: dihydropteroate synthase [Actinomycetota bacterium]